MERLSPHEAFVANPTFGSYEDPKIYPWATREFIADAKRKAAKLLPWYLAQKRFHVYLMTSLRTLSDYEKAEEAVLQIEKLTYDKISDLAIVHVGGLAVPDNFDGELRRADAKIGLEHELLRKSKCGFMLLGDTETLGKISESVHMLLTHRQVVVYTENPRLYSAWHDNHPLRVAGNDRSARGYHTTNTFEQAMECLTNVILGKRNSYKEPVFRGANYYCTTCDSLIRYERPRPRK